MAATQRSRQKKEAKRKQKREQLRKGSRKRALPTSISSLVRLASQAPLGPCWISESVWKENDGAVDLVTIIVTRALPGSLLLAHVILVDRTCLGVKNAAVMAPMDEDTLLLEVVRVQQQRMVLCEPHFAQSIVYNAIDYARSLGFEPHRDFTPLMLGARPEPLEDTPHAKRAKPLYFAGPYDDVQRILAQLERSVGPDGYEAVTEGLWDGDDLEEDFSTEGG